MLVIGGGISGLYTAYKYLEKNPEKDMILIEKTSKLGGRAKQIVFNNVLVPSGAGVGRLKKDKKLYKILHELKLPTQVFETKIGYVGVTPFPILKTIEELKTKYKDTTLNFEEWFISIKDKDTFQRFCDACGYTDFCKLNVKDALYNYGFDDVVSGENKFTVPWNDLIETLSQKILTYPKAKLILKTQIKEVKGKNEVKLSDNTIIQFTNVKICIPPSDILESNVKELLYEYALDYVSNVHGQSFCYVYGVTTDLNIVNYTVVPPPLQKIIPFGNNVFMLAYADNEHADYLYKHIKTAKEMEELIKRILKIDVKIKKIKVIYWNHGTHYRTVEHENIGILKGEAFAVNQGWINGGL